MELEVSYHETYCVEGQAERRRGVPGSVDGGGEAVGMACVDRHTFFITPLMLLSQRQIALAPTMSPAPLTATANHDSYGGVAGHNPDYPFTCRTTEAVMQRHEYLALGDVR